MKNIIYLASLILLLIYPDNSYTQHLSPPQNIPRGEGTTHRAVEPLQYRSIGPSRGGRVTAVAGVAMQENVFYMGATGGGLWKTSDYGFHWENISDGFFASPSIGAIAVCQNNPDIVYVGTGSDGIRSNVIVGKGMYKSTDAGKTWNFSGLKNAGQIGSLIIHPKDPDKVYAAVIGQPFRKSVERGVYMTDDGGEIWQNILFLSDSVGAVDLEFAPDNPDIIYAAMWRAERKPWTIISGGAEDGIYKSMDGGKSWEKKTKGLPEGLTGKIDFAVSSDMPSRVWAQVQATYGTEGLYRSDDYAETWERVIMPPATHKSIMYRPFYFTNLSADPQNANHILSGTKIYWESFDGGRTWNKIPTTHSDHHDLWINPENPMVMIEGNDGGAAVSRDGGANWSTLFNQPTAELYSCDVDDQYPYYLYSGQQDNSTIRVPSRRPYPDVLDSNDNHGLADVMYWEDMGGCETGPAVPKPGDPNIIYANCKGQFSVYNKELGVEHAYWVGAESLYSNHPSEITYRFQRVTPVEVSPHNPDVVYYGSQFVHKTSNGGRNWEVISPDLTANIKGTQIRSGGPIDEDISGEEYYNVLYAIEESPHTEGVIWTGSNDGKFFITRDGGLTWNDITPDMPAGGRVSNIEVSPHMKGSAYYAVYRDYLGDDKPYIYFTSDFGRSWKNLAEEDSGIPSDFVARVVREDPLREGLLYAGTEYGLFISFDNGKSWRSFQRNLPIVPITDLRIVRNDLAISTLGRSFWIMDDISPLRYMETGENESIKLFKPRNVIAGPQRFHFTIPEEMRNEEIFLQVFRNEELIWMCEPDIGGYKPDETGLFRIDWDLRHMVDGEKMFFKQPMVSPGRYSVILAVGDKTDKQEFEFIINPELEDAGTSVADLREQEELALKVASLLQEISERIDLLEVQISGTDNKRKLAGLNDQLNLLKKGPRRYDKPKIAEHTEYLYEMITNTPQKVGKDAFERYSTLKEEYETIKQK